tara:strand:+ start:655 stop:1185 length:531 start_codon:yes stop_codon:yes gene_type:complete
MGYQIGDRKLPLDVAFDHNEIQYPANWLRLSTAEQRDELGITWVADTSQIYDQRFYWGVDNPKDLDDLKTLWKSKQSEIATSLLAPSDWRVIKAKETSSTMPAAWKTYRAAIRTACNTRQTEIDACSDVAALKELMTGSEQINQTDADGNDVLDGDGNSVMIANPNIATAWPDPID